MRSDITIIKELEFELGIEFKENYYLENYYTKNNYGYFECDKNENVVKLLIASKIDLKDKREVTKEEGIKYSNQFTWSGDIISTSSKTGENVEKAFVTLATEMMTNNFHLCEACGDIFDIKLRYCVHCGEKIKT